jgi:glycosyltransferase involved in cell wall biosynthesis
MKILQVCPRYYPDIGGVEEHVRNISERLAEKYDVSVFTTDPSGKLPKQEVINSVKIRRFKSWAPDEAYYFSREIKKCLMKNSDCFDIVHAHSYHAFPGLYAANAKKVIILSLCMHARLWRFEKGGYCKQARKNCSSLSCPQVPKFKE